MNKQNVHVAASGDDRPYERPVRSTSRPLCQPDRPLIRSIVIVFLSGVPWQNATAGTRHDVARLRTATVAGRGDAVNPPLAAICPANVKSRCPAGHHAVAPRRGRPDTIDEQAFVSPGPARLVCPPTSTYPPRAHGRPSCRRVRVPTEERRPGAAAGRNSGSAFAREPPIRR